jgi:hypothetical protein
VVQKLTKGAKAYSILLSDGVWYGAGFDKPDVAEGDFIEFDVEENGKYKNVRKGSIKVIPQESKKTEARVSEDARSKARPTSGGTTSRDSYWDDKAEKDIRVQKEIRLQASRNAAIAFTDLLLKNEALPGMTAAKKNKAEIIEAAVSDYTRKFYSETENGISSVASSGDEDAFVGEEANGGSYE